MTVQRLLASAMRKAVTAALLATASALSSQAPDKLSPPRPAPATAPDAASTAGQPPQSHAMTAEDLAAFLDGFMSQQLQRENIAGAVVLVVKDGKVLYEQGFGYADVASKTPVSPSQTLFRPGSVSKLFTWTAVMQLVEQGKINLDENINTYLDFKVPDTFPKPITMRQLMTHTAGFEEAVKDLGVLDNSPIPALRDYLVTHMPQRVYAPGTTPAYSNYGATLAGYIVQRLSGLPFDDYVDQKIFAPLGMSHSTFRQPLPPALAPMMSSGYTLASDDAKPFERISVGPAGSSSVTAEDISHFMLAHLQQGQYQGAAILKPATIALMHSPQFAMHPQLPHMCLGFYEETHNGHRIIGHGGDTEWFHSDLHLMQDQNLGFFVSYNSAGRSEIDARGALFQAFLDRYFPYSIPSAAPQPNALKDAQTVAGEYIVSRRPVTNILSFVGILENSAVSPAHDGSITIDSLKGINQLPKTWIEIGPLLYREKDGQALVAFTRDSANRLVLSTDFPFEVSTRASLADNKIWNYTLLAFIAIVCMGALLSWPIAAWMRRHYQHPLALTRTRKRLRLILRIVAALDLAFFAGWTALFLSSNGEPLFDARLDPLLRLFQVIGWLGVLGAIAVLYAVVQTWKAPGEWWLTRTGNAAMAIAAISFVWILIHWHFLHLSLNY